MPEVRRYKLSSGEELEVPCSLGLRLASRVDDLEAWTRNHTDEQREDFKQLKDELREALTRPPAWVTVSISTLTCIIGVLAGALWAIQSL